MQAQKFCLQSPVFRVCSRTSMESALPQNASSMNEVVARINTSLPKFTTPKWRAATPKNVRLTAADKILDQRIKLRFLEKRRARLKKKLDFFSAMVFGWIAPHSVVAFEKTQIRLRSRLPAMLPRHLQVRARLSSASSQARFENPNEVLDISVF